MDAASTVSAAAEGSSSSSSSSLLLLLKKTNVVSSLMKDKVNEETATTIHSTAAVIPATTPVTTASLSETLAHFLPWPAVPLSVLCTTLLLTLILSNSLTRALQMIRSDNITHHWEAIYLHICSWFSSPFHRFVTATFLLHISIFWLFAGIMTYFDLQATTTTTTIATTTIATTTTTRALPHILSRYKMQPTKNVPLDRAKLFEAIRMALFNQFFVALPLQALSYPIAMWRGCSIDLPLPSFQAFLWTLFGSLVIEEMLFYYTHRLLHSKLLYGPIHKLHHQWTAPIAISAMHCHPIEHALGNLLPAMVGPIMFGSHLAVMWVWQSMAVFVAVNTHCGYHLPFLPSPESHEFHHMRFNENFGVLGILDWWHGTDTAFRRSEQYKHHRSYLGFNLFQPGLVVVNAVEHEQEQDGRFQDINETSANSTQ